MINVKALPGRQTPCKPKHDTLSLASAGSQSPVNPAPIQNLVLTRVPNPQVTLQVPQAPQAFQEHLAVEIINSFHRWTILRLYHQSTFLRAGITLFFLDKS